jgi:hypothetical protein
LIQACLVVRRSGVCGGVESERFASAISNRSRRKEPHRSRRHCRSRSHDGHGGNGRSAACSSDRGGNGHSRGRNRRRSRSRSSGQRRTRAQHRKPGRRSSGPHSSERHSRTTGCTGCGSNGHDGTAGGRTADGRSHYRSHTPGPHRSRKRSRSRSRRRSRHHRTFRTVQTRSPATRDTTDPPSGHHTQGSSWKFLLARTQGDGNATTRVAGTAGPASARGFWRQP